MDSHTVVRLTAIGRIFAGVVMLVAPTLAMKVFGAEAAGTPGKVLARVIGIRDLALGIGTFRALDRGVDSATWARLGALCDGGDTVISAIALPGLPKGRTLAVMAVAGSSAAANALAASDLEQG